jgi:hypothetical protein
MRLTGVKHEREVTNANIGGLSLLCDEFRFAALSARLSAFRRSSDFQEAAATEDPGARLRLSALEERLLRRDHEFAALRQAQESMAATLGNAVARLSRVEARFAPTPSDPVAPAKGLAPPAQRISPSAKAARPAPPIPQQRDLTPEIDSRIISEFPEIFAEFRGKRFALLWRGGRDGFGAPEFHSRCDGHANTLTLIEDTKGNIFGGFTPLKWESPKERKLKSDHSRRSFLFTLRNPHNVPARKFAVKEKAICCCASWGPDFRDISVAWNANANINSGTALGASYTNDTRMDGKSFFTGSIFFQVKEIEVFEIAV